jgi:hypothetical protein
MAAGLQRSSGLVPEPTSWAVLEDTLIGLTCLKNDCCWKKYWMLRTTMITPHGSTTELCSNPPREADSLNSFGMMLLGGLDYAEARE